MKRAPLWFTHGQTKARIQRYWPYGFGILMGGMYYIAPEPFEEVRVATLARVRKPVLRGTEWLETRDVDPETAALELPPDQIFGPLPMKQQLTFLLAALRDDNELADGYVARFLIDLMDFGMEPNPFAEELVNNGAHTLLDFAIADFEETRAESKHKFFAADQFLRLVNVICNVPDLADHFVFHAATPSSSGSVKNKNAAATTPPPTSKLPKTSANAVGVDLIFKALDEATNEYSRIFASRALTMFAFLQPRDGIIERRIIDGGHLPRLIDLYRQSTGDPTDTRYTTMLISSCLRQFPKDAYPIAVGCGLVGAAIANLNITRYKGAPQHLRILDDLNRVRPAISAAGLQKAKDIALARGKAHDADVAAAAEAEAQFQAQVKQPRIPITPMDTYFDKLQGTSISTGQHPNESSSSATTSSSPPSGSRSGGGGRVVGGGGAEGTLGALERPMTLEDPSAPVAQMLAQADFMPVALGVLELFPEYLESTEKVVRWLAQSRPYVPTIDLLEYRMPSVLCRVFGRLDGRAEWIAHPSRREALGLAKGILDDPVCAQVLRTNAGGKELASAVETLRGLLEQQRLRDEGGAAAAATTSTATSAPAATAGTKKSSAATTAGVAVATA